MNLMDQGKASYLISIGYYEADAGWTHKDHGGKCFTLNAAYDYEVEQFGLQNEQQ
jgi:hypothetical protein